MPLPSVRKEYVEGSTISDFGYTSSDVTSAVAGLTLAESPTASLVNAANLYSLKSNTDSPLLSNSEAMARMQEQGIQLEIPKEGIREGAFNFLIEKRKESMRREMVLSSEANQGRMLKNLGIGVAASFSDPLNIATALLPGIGMMKIAKTLDTVTDVAGATMGIQAASRGANAARVSQALKGTKGVIGESVAGAVLAESLVLPSQKYLQSDYDMYDSLINVGVGTVFAGTLHGVARGGKNLFESRAMRRAEIAEKQQKARLERKKADVRGRNAEAQVETPEQRISDKMLGASPETRESVLHAFIARAITGKEIDVEKIIDADIDAFAARQVFELDELELTLDEHFDLVFEEFKKLNSEQFLGKRKTQRNKKLIRELQRDIEALYNKDAWTDYRATARKNLKGKNSKQKISRLAESMRDEARDSILFRISELRDRIETGRNAGDVRSSLDKLQQTTEDFSFIKDSVLEQASELQAKIDAHPETLRRASEETAKYADSSADIHFTANRSKEVSDRVDDAAKIDETIEGDEVDVEIEAAKELINERHADQASEAELKDIEESAAVEMKKAEAIRKSKSCILG